MKILQVVTLVSPDGAYGGPVRVAVNQLRELQRLGHDVELVAGCRGFGASTPTSIDGVRVRLFEVWQPLPRLGYAGLSAQGLSKYVRNRLSEVDVVHVHLARDLITMPVAAAVAKSTTPLILQTHGMILKPRNLQGRVFDTVLTKQVLRKAALTLTLTAAEASNIAEVAGPDLRLEAIANGVPSPAVKQAAPTTLNVLFLARLHERKRPLMFVQMAKQLIDEGFDVTFSIVGPDEGEAPSVTRFIELHGLGNRIVWEGALAPEDTLSRIAECSIYVLPSIGEVFPMSVLEAMSIGRPVVITSSNGLAESLATAGAALVADESLDGLVDATRSLLLSQELRETLSRKALAEVALRYSIENVARQLAQIYTRFAQMSRSHS